MMSLLGLAGPSTETIDKASQAITESNVFGAAFIVMLGVFVSIVVVLFAMLRARDKQHTKERKEMREEFEEERERMEKVWDERFKKYGDLLDKQIVARDNTYRELGDVQEKRVQQAIDIVAIAATGNEQIRQLVELIKNGMVEGDDDDS